jgi:RNA polymerase sigma factor (sigma-70 family)
MRPSDPLLDPFLTTPEPEASELLGRLLQELAEPIIRKVVHFRLGGEARLADARDLLAEIEVRLIERLHALKRQAGEPIADFRGYVAVAAYRACADYFRGAPRRRATAEGGADLAELPAVEASLPQVLGQRSQLQTLWGEIRQLPPRQCAALLLHLRDDDGRDAVGLFPLTGTASLRDIARQIGLPAERLAEVWNRLPLDALAIADLLGVTRQQVNNLRKSARERLARRMKKLPGWEIGT